jgi:hypothetical protein
MAEMARRARVHAARGCRPGHPSPLRGRCHEELGGLARVHWSIPDPVPTGTRAAFDATHDELAERIEALAPAIA